jgi:sulfate adenylyltransferase large subunit
MRPSAEQIFNRRTELLRFTTAGSVDDGKSTLIGRLLMDTESIFEDQLAHVRDATEKSGRKGVDLALVTDGLRAEREQGITIDVAYRYFSTDKRSFIIADTPGHIQYTRNMVTGASTANLAIVLIDARQGVLTQTKRHAFLATLLGIPHIVVAVNKMDLVDWDEARWDEIRAAFRDWSARLDVRDLRFVPISALHGDNVAERTQAAPWYRGPSLLQILEDVEIASDRNLVDFRFPVQLVSRPQSDDEWRDFRGYAGRVESGAVHVGDEIVALPSGLRSTVRRIATWDGDRREAFAPQSVTIELADDLDISRGDMLVRPGNVPRIEKEWDAILCWMGEEPLELRKRYLVKHTTQEVRCMVDALAYRVDVDTLHRDVGIEKLEKNEIGRVHLRATKALFLDDYTRNRGTGSFILVDEHTNQTVAAGMIRPASSSVPDPRAGV